tara:strand:+ start:57 stop:251 length:195 start_codon:yes stop_codon:yes gene_type:complete
MDKVANFDNIDCYTPDAGWSVNETIDIISWDRQPAKTITVIDFSIEPIIRMLEITPHTLIILKR